MKIKQTNNKMAKRPFLTYSLLFALMGLIIFSVFYFSGQTFIWQNDGYHQHFAFFVEYLDILREFFQTGDFRIWDWTIGLGADTVSSYGYYVIGDPFTYLALLFRPGSEELAFNLIMLVRIYCVGLSFLFFSKSLNFNKKGAIIGAVTYTFSHFVVYNIVRHPFFIHPMIFFPLICVGIEWIFQKKSAVLFMAMIALSAASNFYFFYMLTILMFIYAVIRYGHYYDYRDIKRIFKNIGAFLLYYLIGILIASVLFLPMVYGFLTSSRSLGSPPISMLVYPPFYYVMLLVNSVTPGTTYWTVGGTLVIVALGLGFLWRKKEKPMVRTSLIMLAILSVFLLVPFFGSMMNGFSGPYNRFTFVMPFLQAILIAYVVNNLDDFNFKDVKWMKYVLIAISIFYVVVALVTQDFAVYLTPILIAGLLYFAFKQLLKRKPQAKLVIVGLILINAVINGLNFHAPYGKDAAAGTMKTGESISSYANVFNGAEKYLPENTWYRLGVTSKDQAIRNELIYINEMGLNSYTSVTNAAVSEFAQSMNSNQFELIQPLRAGVDDRRIINNMLGVQYIITEFENAGYLPLGYDVFDTHQDMVIAETDEATPFAYVETDRVARADFDALHPTEREQVFEKAVVVENDINSCDIEIQVNTHDFETSGLDVKTLDNGKHQVQVSDETNQLKINFDNIEDEELFIALNGMAFQPQDNFLNTVNPSTSYALTVDYGGKTFETSQNDAYLFSSYFKRDDLLLNLNAVEDNENSLTITFNTPGTYTFDSIDLLSRPYDEAQSEQYAQEKQDAALNIKSFENERVIGSVTSEESGTLVTSIPYSPFWKVTLNGAEVPTEVVNVGFIGLPIEAGEYDVEMTYSNPTIKIGAVLSITGIILVAIYVIRRRGKMK